jgi:hypothetical protein
MERLNQTKCTRVNAKMQWKDEAVSAHLGSGDGRDSLSNSGNVPSVSREQCADGRWDVAVQTYLPSTPSEASTELPLVRFWATVAPWGRSSVELQWAGGRCRDALHQIVLFCRNALSTTSPLSEAR